MFSECTELNPCIYWFPGIGFRPGKVIETEHQCVMTFADDSPLEGKFNFEAFGFGKTDPLFDGGIFEFKPFTFNELTATAIHHPDAIPAPVVPLPPSALMLIGSLLAIAVIRRGKGK